MAAKKGFTLMEILVVLVILGVVAAFSIPGMMAASEQTRAESTHNNLLAIAAGQQRYSEDNNGTYCLTTNGTPCGTTSQSLFSSLSLYYSSGDPFTYTCAASNPYTCIATDTIVKLTMVVTSLNGAVVTCTDPVGNPTNNCPS